MAISSYKMGPGTLKLGTGGTEDASAQVTRCVVSTAESVSSTDDVIVLTGETLDGEDTVSLDWTLSGALLQDITSAGLIEYTWTNAGDEVDFEFIPNTAAGRKVTGVCRLVPLAVGGDANSRPSSDFEFKVIGTPALGTVV